eukprot:14639670-Alexandrium_andersonii.AAC.1
MKRVVHGDDFALAGCDEDLDWAQSCVEMRFLRKIEGRLGGGGSGLKEARLLNLSLIHISEPTRLALI